MEENRNSLHWSPRSVFFAGFAFCAGLIAVALFLQHVQGLEPCPLCVSQRIAFITAGTVFLAAALHNPGRFGLRVYAVLGFLASLAGAGIAARHVWLQHLPPEEVPACGPGVEYMLRNFPFAETLKFMLSGTGDCAKVDWTLLGLSIPGWTLISFLLLAALCAFQFWRARPSRFLYYKV
jgi:disulfide bond formation protein DsbB